MKRIPWTIEEAVVFLDFYLKNGEKYTASSSELQELVVLLNKRAKKLGMEVDAKFRNLSGLKLQLVCMHHVVHEDECCHTNPSKVFYRAFELLKSDRERFNKIVQSFYAEYDTPRMPE